MEAAAGAIDRTRAAYPVRAGWIFVTPVVSKIYELDSRSGERHRRSITPTHCGRVWIKSKTAIGAGS